jgi:hypothetical protein
LATLETHNHSVNRALSMCQPLLWVDCQVQARFIFSAFLSSY